MLKADFLRSLRSVLGLDSGLVMDRKDDMVGSEGLLLLDGRGDLLRGMVGKANRGRIQTTKKVGRKARSKVNFQLTERHKRGETSKT